MSLTREPSDGSPTRRLPASTLAGAGAALLWLAWCVRFFDVAAPWRPAVLEAVPALALLLSALVLLGLWLDAHWPALAGPRLERPVLRGLLLVVALAFFARLPFVTHGAASVMTPDGTLYGNVTERLLEGVERPVFIPGQPYGGTLKSILVAPVAMVMDPARAFALVSVLFYLLFVAGLYRLTAWLFGPRAALLAGLYAAFPPVFVNRYSLSNDGTYVELLALGTWALWLAARWTKRKDDRTAVALVIGVLLGLGFWLHLLAVIHLAAIALAFALLGGRDAPRSFLALGAGSTLGAAPALLWNAVNGWQSFENFVPGKARGVEEGLGGILHGLGGKVMAFLTGDLPVLMGYDQGYGPVLDRVFVVVGWLGVMVAAVATVRVAVTAVRRRSAPLALLLLFVVMNVAVAVLALSHVPGNPRYLITLMSVLPAFMADAFGTGWRRWLLAVLIAVSALANLSQLKPTMERDARWRDFVARLQSQGVRYCYTDFHLATRINFLSDQQVICCSKLGPFTTEYIFDYRREVEAAPEAAFITVNRTAANRLGERLDEMGVGYERIDMMKPVILRLDRKLDPEDVFPWREFPWR
jgi:hypothetical protein